MTNKAHAYIIITLLLAVAGLLPGCQTTNTSTTTTLSKNPTHSGYPVPSLPKKLVAIAGFENKSTFAADKLWDTSSELLSTELINAGYFRTVEWGEMKRLFDWDILSTNTLIQSPKARNDARKILLCEYFLTGAVTAYDIKQASRVSALSKSKTITTTIKVSLLLQDAVTGEYLSAGNGSDTQTQHYTTSGFGGQNGGWSPEVADLALEKAIQKALKNLTNAYHQRS